MIQMSNKHDQCMQSIADYKSNLAYKINHGELEESFATGSTSFTQNEWKKLIEKIDQQIDTIKEEQEEKQEQRTEEEKNKDIYEKLSHKITVFRTQTMYDRLQNQDKIPYANLVVDGMINYNGVTFACDYEKNAICLGDMTQTGKVLTIPLEKGGSLKVNVDNLSELSHAFGMFSPEDKLRILQAISTYQKIKSELAEIEDDTNSIGDSAEDNILDSK